MSNATPISIWIFLFRHSASDFRELSRTAGGHIKQCQTCMHTFMENKTALDVRL